MFGLRTVGSILRHLSSSLRAKPIQLSAVSSSPIPQHELVDEEHCPAYNPKVFYPAKPGETLAERYQLLVKIGWGTRSTVWLAQDMARYVWWCSCYIVKSKLLIRMVDSGTDGSLEDC